MNTLRILAATSALAAFGVPGAAQLATSTNYQLLDTAVVPGGGGSCSVDYAGWFTAVSPSGEETTSAGYQLEVGFVAAHDTEPANAPVVFGVDPLYETYEGGTTLTVTGLNFDKFGVGPSVTVDIEGVPATGVNVLSDTMLECVTPAAAAPGPSDVVVTSSYGPDTLDDGYIFYPGVTATEIAVLVGEPITIKNYGPASSLFIQFWSPLPTFIPLGEEGVLLIGPEPVIQAYVDAYPVDGPHEFTFNAPNLPAFPGITIYYQTSLITNLSPVELFLSNRAQTTLP